MQYRLDNGSTYFPNLDSNSVIFDIGGKSKIADIQKYEDMADILIPILH